MVNKAVFSVISNDDRRSIHEDLIALVQIEGGILQLCGRVARYRWTVYSLWIVVLIAGLEDADTAEIINGYSALFVRILTRRKLLTFLSSCIHDDLLIVDCVNVNCSIYT